ncbi:C45 family autoproteolytic acyltransferase/hydolase [Thalassobacillus hwangdonensis]|uniref:C45 family autoproteolytic acyltransferase/hydrolase n=1 Tax=Thalassobacillus hwangdonensis TaxID=546108 RepID=A0ABW3L0M1_9BACI
MEPLQVTIEQYRGRAYQLGYQQGRELDPQLPEKISILENENFSINNMIETFEAYAPHLIDELKGLADGLNWTFEKTASRFSGYDLPKISGMGCSSMVNEAFAVRNYDFSPDLYDKRLVLIQPQECLASIGYSLHVIGRHEGVNEKGLFIALHFVGNENPKPGLAASTVVRIVLDTCTTTEEAIALLQKLPHAWSYNYSLADAYGSTAVVEASTEKVTTRNKPNTLSCTNHFQHIRKETDATYSHARFESMESTGPKDFSSAFEWFKDPASPLFFHAYHQLFGTLHTFAYDFEKGIVLTALPYGDTLKVDWSAWVDGKPLPHKLLTGKLIAKNLREHGEAMGWTSGSKP